jgi:hypothetical protein
MSPVDAFIAQSVRPEYHGLVAVLREVMREAAPDAALAMSYGLPMWKGRGYLAYLSPSQRGLTFGFPYGAHFSDPHGVLQGHAKHARHLKYRRVGDVDESVLRSYVAQAVARDARAAESARAAA